MILNIAPYIAFHVEVGVLVRAFFSGVFKLGVGVGHRPYHSERGVLSPYNRYTMYHTHTTHHTSIVLVWLYTILSIVITCFPLTLSLCRIVYLLSGLSLLTLHHQ